jgi:O-acetyl-ADP-ribose deacetylase (regulator of RNase III)
MGITSIAVPALGTGNGGLLCEDIAPLLVAAFEQVPDVRMILYAPM